MKHSKKILALAMSIAVVASIAAAGTLAYLTGNGSVTNTFNVGAKGSVAIDLFESKVVDGVIPEGGEKTTTKTDAVNVKENAYVSMLPNQTFDKDPAVLVEANSADSYVFMAVKNNLTASWTGADGDTVTISGDSCINYVNDNGATVSGIKINDAWTYVGKTAGGAEVYAYAGDNNNDVAESSETTRYLPNLFDQVHVNADLGGALSGTIEVKAFAIQADAIEANTALEQAQNWFNANGFGA